jgi:hypothetical protein
MWSKSKRILVILLLVVCTFVLTAQLNAILKNQFDLGYIALPSFLAWIASFYPIWYRKNGIANRLFAWFLGSLTGVSFYFLWRSFVGLWFIRNSYLDAHQVSNLLYFHVYFCVAISIGMSWWVSLKGCQNNILSKDTDKSEIVVQRIEFIKVFNLLTKGFFGLAILMSIHRLAQMESGLFYMHLNDLGF